MPTRIVIDTDDLRTATQYLEGALDQLTQIRLALTQVGAVVDEIPDHASRRQQLLAGIERLGAALTDDRTALAQEVLDLEAQEGQPPAGSTGPAAAAPGTANQLGLPMIGMMALPRIGSQATGNDPPPEPWDTPWVNPDGSVPTGPTTGGSGTSTSTSAGFGAKWDDRDETGDDSLGASGAVDAETSAWAYGEAHAGQTEDGGYTAGESAGTGVALDAHAEGEAHAGPLGVSGAADVELEAHAEESAEVSIGPDGVAVAAEASAGAKASASAQGTASLGDHSVSGEVHGEAEAEAHGRGEAHLGKDGVGYSADAGAFAGTSAGGSVTGGVGDSSVGAGAEVKAGVGVELGASGGISGEGIDVSVSLGAALGLGLSIELDIHVGWDSLNPLSQLEDLYDTANSAMDAVTGLFDDAGGSVEPPAAAADEVGAGPPTLPPPVRVELAPPVGPADLRDVAALGDVRPALADDLHAVRDVLDVVRPEHLDIQAPRSVVGHDAFARLHPPPPTSAPVPPPLDELLHHPPTVPIDPGPPDMATALDRLMPPTL